MGWPEWRRRLGVLGLAAAAQAAVVAEALPATLVEGVWLTAEKSELTITTCDEGLCGYISKIVVPEHIIAKYGEDIEAMGADFTDQMNKDPALRQRPIHGLQILTLRPGREVWHFEGEIYNPQDGNVYSGSVQVTGPDRLMLKGCVLYVLCQQQEWTRVVAEE